jgi:phage replication initiation protein
MKTLQSPSSLIQVSKLTPADYANIGNEVSEMLACARIRAEAAAAGEASGARPRGVAAASHPHTNRGGKSGTASEAGAETGVEVEPEWIAAHLVLEDGKVLEVPGRRTWGGSSAFVDWVSFTTVETDYYPNISVVSDDEVVKLISEQVQRIFGFGITQERELGLNFYKSSYVLGEGYGQVGYGGQRSTVLVTISGDGCDAAKPGWQNRLYDFLNGCKSGRARITRVDVAHDDYTGATYSVDKADAAFDEGLFNCGGRNPNHEYRGNWKHPNGKGRTINVGTRKNGKFCRVYEKGRQLGDKDSEWVRIEVEFKSVDREIPNEILLHPGQYLAAAYPALNWISAVQERILTVQKKLGISYQTAVRNVKVQFGKMLWVMRQIEGNAEVVLQKVMREGFPSRLNLPMWQESGRSIHEEPDIPILGLRNFMDSLWMT